MLNDIVPAVSLVLILAAALAARYLLDRVFFSFLSNHENDPVDEHKYRHLFFGSKLAG